MEEYTGFGVTVNSYLLLLFRRVFAKPKIYLSFSLAPASASAAVLTVLVVVEMGFSTVAVVVLNLH